jgi:hypothetical protein
MAIGKFRPKFRAAALIALCATPSFACDLPAEEAEGLLARPDGTIRLKDGRDIKLAGVELADAGREALSALVAGKPLTLHRVGQPDRWNRQPAHIEEIEEKFLAAGLGHAAAQAESTCLAPLLAAEEKARKSRAGIWSDERYVLAAADGAALTERLGQHIIAEGTVQSAREDRGRVYLNFARYWKSGLSLIIAEKDWPHFARGAAIEAIAGKRLRARGRLEYRAGPAILMGPDDRIEILP